MESDGEIDYTSYSLPQLLEAKEAINRERYPKNYANLCAAINSASAGPADTEAVQYAAGSPRQATLDQRSQRLDSQKPMTSRYAKIWWFLFWRTALFSIIAGLIVGIILGVLLMFSGVSTQAREIIYQVAGLLVSIPVGIWVVSLLFEKSFSDFKVVIVRNDTEE